MWIRPDRLRARRRRAGRHDRIGGGSLMTPMLILVFGVTPVTAIGTDLAYAAVTKTVGGYKHWRQRTVDMKLSSWMALGSVPAAIGGVYVLDAARGRAGQRLRRHADRRPRRAPCCSPARPTLVRSFLKTHPRARARHDRDERRHKIAAVGARRVRRLRARRDLGRQRRADRGRADPAVPARAHASRRHRRLPRRDPALGGRPAHIVAGNVDFGLAGNILVGSVPGVWIGSHWSVRVAAGGAAHHARDRADRRRARRC